MARAPKLLFTSCQRGSVAVQSAFVLPVLVLFVLGIMDTGRLLWTFATLHRASEAAARCGAIPATGTDPATGKAYDCTTSSGTQNYAVLQAWGLTTTASVFTVSTPACGNQVAASYNFTFVIPWFYIVPPLGPSNSITLTATACYPTVLSP
jgi:Flp pilus assembly protein TadG